VGYFPVSESKRVNRDRICNARGPSDPICTGLKLGVP
jgi:hypothetical protein